VLGNFHFFSEAEIVFETSYDGSIKLKEQMSWVYQCPCNGPHADIKVLAST
jgi:hypothetical protein